MTDTGAVKRGAKGGNGAGAGGRSRSRRAAGGTGGPTRLDVLDTIFPPRKAAELATGLWAAAGVVGLVAAGLPHGTGVRSADWWGLGSVALVVAALWWWRGERLSRAVQYLVSLGAVLGVGATVAHAGGTASAFTGVLLYVIVTVYAASFYPDRALAVFVVVLAGTSAAALLPSHVPGAPVAWVTAVLTCVAVAGCVRALEHALGRAANTDPLTGLVNRRALEPVLERELARCSRLGHPLSVAIIDLDGFKRVNDTLGHHAGDRLLVDVTRAWRNALRTPDVLARSGGDEFLLLLPSTSADAAATVLGRLRRLHDQAFSAGVAESGPDASVSTLLRRADAACYRAKQRGRGRTVVADLASPARPAAVDGALRRSS